MEKVKRKCNFFFIDAKARSDNINNTNSAENFIYSVTHFSCFKYVHWKKKCVDQWKENLLFDFFYNNLYRYQRKLIDVFSS